MLVFGGLSNNSQYSNMFIYNIEKNLWSEIPLHLDSPRWNFNTILIPSLPNYKLFIFGGSFGYFDEGSVRNFGTLSNDVYCITLNDNPELFQIQTVKLDNRELMPSPRESSIIIFD